MTRIGDSHGTRRIASPCVLTRMRSRPDSDVARPDADAVPPGLGCVLRPRLRVRASLSSPSGLVRKERGRPQAVTCGRQPSNRPGPGKEPPSPRSRSEELAWSASGRPRAVGSWVSASTRRRNRPRPSPGRPLAQESARRRLLAGGPRGAAWAGPSGRAFGPVAARLGGGVRRRGTDSELLRPASRVPGGRQPRAHRHFGAVGTRSGESLGTDSDRIRVTRLGRGEPSQHEESSQPGESSCVPKRRLRRLVRAPVRRSAACACAPDGSRRPPQWARPGPRPAVRGGSSPKGRGPGRGSRVRRRAELACMCPCERRCAACAAPGRTSRQGAADVAQALASGMASLSFWPQVVAQLLT